jgi:hypothetical protein
VEVGHFPEEDGFGLELGGGVQKAEEAGPLGALPGIVGADPVGIGDGGAEAAECGDESHLSQTGTVA